MQADFLSSQEAILGHSFILSLTDPKYGLLQDGRRMISKHELVTRFGTGNFHAARNLAKAMKALGFTKLDELFSIPAAHLADIPGFGRTTLYVVLCIARARKIDIGKWYREGISFDALKHRATRDAREERKDTKARAKRRSSSALQMAGTKHLKMAG